MTLSADTPRPRVPPLALARALHWLAGWHRPPQPRRNTPLPLPHGLPRTADDAAARLHNLANRARF